MHSEANGSSRILNLLGIYEICLRNHGTNRDGDTCIFNPSAYSKHDLTWNHVFVVFFQWLTYLNTEGGTKSGGSGTQAQISLEL